MSISNHKSGDVTNAKRAIGIIVIATLTLLIIAAFALPWFPDTSRLITIFSLVSGVLGLLLSFVSGFPNYIPRLTLPKVPRSTTVCAILLIFSLISNAFLFGRQGSNLTPTPKTKPLVTSSPTVNTTPSSGVLNVPLPAYIAGHGTLIISNPWINNNPAFQWDITNETGSGKPGAGNCEFTADGFHISADKSYRECVEYTTNLTNCVFEVQMTQLPGSAGGLILRRDKVSNVGGYLVALDQSGNYTITLDKDAHNSVELGGNSIGLIQKNHAPYLVDVEALGNQITLYVDKVKIDEVTDSTFNLGLIGLFVTQYGGTSQKTGAIFTNLRVWHL